MPKFGAMKQNRATGILEHSSSLPSPQIENEPPKYLAISMFESPEMLEVCVGICCPNDSSECPKLPLYAVYSENDLTFPVSKAIRVVFWVATNHSAG